VIEVIVAIHLEGEVALSRKSGPISSRTLQHAFNGSIGEYFGEVSFKQSRAQYLPKRAGGLQH
jgi:hypothetical protein